MDRGKLLITVFLELSKAFDTLNHSILLDKLKYYGFSNTPLNWFASYLQNRMQFADFDGTLSNTVLMTTGVQQGSILGPLLSIIYMNDIREASENFKAKFICGWHEFVQPVMCIQYIYEFKRYSNRTVIRKYK